MMADKIPSNCLYRIPRIACNPYTHSQIDDFFSVYKFKVSIETGINKEKKIRSNFIAVNNESDSPLAVLGEFIKPLMEKRGEGAAEIDNVLAGCGLQYESGNIIPAAPLNIFGEIKKSGISAVNAEIERILREIDKDPMSAVHRSVSLMEAALKVYLETQKIPFKENEEFSPLWDKFTEALKIRPNGLENENYRRIASGLYSIIHGTRELRNSESAAHGKSERKYQEIKIKPRHARLVAHAAGALADYVLDCREESVAAEQAAAQQ